MEALTGITISELSAPGVLLAGVLLIYFGILVPRPFYKQALADRDARLAEKDARLEEQAETISKQDRHITLLLAAVRTTEHVLESLPLDEARRADVQAEG